MMSTSAEKKVERFNAAHPVGTRVRYWPLVRSGDPTGQATTSAPAELWPGGVAVVRVAKDGGGTDVIALTHVEVIR